jgi:hypothetical protein
MAEKQMVVDLYCKYLMSFVSKKYALFKERAPVMLLQRCSLPNH